MDIYNWIEKCKKEFQMCDGPLNNVIREELFNVDKIWSWSLKTDLLNCDIPEKMNLIIYAAQTRKEMDRIICYGKWKQLFN